jgi:autotransporter adhesin
VKYDKNADGTTNYTHVTLEGPTSTDGGVTGGTTITNVHQGAVNATSTDAINGAQLYNIAGDTSTSYTTTNGGGVRYVRTNDAGLPQTDAYAKGQGSTAVGYNASTTSTATNAVAIGNNAVASQVGSVALGAGSTTAAAVGTSSTTIGGTTYQFAGTAPSSTVSVGSAGNERTITNVAAGRISATSTDAINGSQLYATNQALEQKVNQSVQQIDNGAVGPVQYSSSGSLTTPNGGTKTNDVTLVGKDTSAPVGLHNLAAGTAATDAVNVGQLDRAMNGLHNDMVESRQDLYGAVAGSMAMANMPQAYIPGKGGWSAGVANIGGESALAIGMSTLSDNGRWVVKASGMVDTRGQTGVGMGVFMHW